jgi:predicted Zn finger-like uncharacterized protein
VDRQGEAVVLVEREAEGGRAAGRFVSPWRNTLSFRVPCPHCQAVCQVGDEYRGKAVQCGKCQKVFQAVPLPEEPAAIPAAVPSGSAAASVPAPNVGAAPSAPTTPDAPRSGIWKGLRGLFGTAKGRQPEAPAGDEVQLALDGPSATVPPEPPSLPARTTKGEQVAPLPGVYRLDIGAATSSGCVRPRNEDSLLVQHLAWSNLDQRHEAAILVVADGMGGYEAGDQASALVVRTLGGSLAGLLAEFLTGQLKENAAPARIDVALKAANKAVYSKGQTDPACKGMGATAAVAVVSDGQVSIGHVGDCRVYHSRDGKLLQVTKDQTLVARMVELGQLSAQEALTHPKRNEVTSAVGRHSDLQPAAYQLKIVPGDWLLVACDGLHAHVSSARLAQALAESPLSAAALAHHLVDLANEGGGSDNCTVVALRCY